MIFALRLGQSLVTITALDDTLKMNRAGISELEELRMSAVAKVLKVGDNMASKEPGSLMSSSTVSSGPLAVETIAAILSASRQ